MVAEPAGKKEHKQTQVTPTVACILFLRTVVLTLNHHRYNAVRDHTGQAPMTVERKITSGGKNKRTIKYFV